MTSSSGRESYFNLNSTWYDPAGSWLDTRRTPFTYAYSTCCCSGGRPREAHDYRCYGYRRSGCAENCHGSSGSCHGSGGHGCVRRPSYFHGSSGGCHGRCVCSEPSCHGSGSSCHAGPQRVARGAVALKVPEFGQSLKDAESLYVVYGYPSYRKMCSRQEKDQCHKQDRCHSSGSSCHGSGGSSCHGGGSSCHSGGSSCHSSGGSSCHGGESSCHSGGSCHGKPQQQQQKVCKVPCQKLK
ncbi:loricrin-like [Mauremys mutica]|uniref:loricrin-like n=1 Tax=Mauremys mutica TaxID=74926 RepID=UPI001D1669BD|nr:loricrin-like [Mauremys mutica]